jgi:hypothetical protein
MVAPWLIPLRKCSFSQHERKKLRCVKRKSIKENAMRPLRLPLSCISVIFVAISALAQSAPPTGDTYSNSAKPTANYGSATILAVNTGSKTYIQINLSTLPAGASVNKATLRLYVDAVVTGGSFDVYQLNTGWTESGLTYNNAPALGSSATGGHAVALTTSSKSQFVVVDITSLVQSWVAGTVTNNGVALALTTAAGNFSFDSKETTDTSHQPELEIVLNGPQGPAGPQGPQGPAGATGAQGPQGPIGPVGPTGQTGLQGAQGPAGVPGATGATGQQGPQGLMGLTGATGPQGAQGPQGPAGANGTSFNFRNAFNSSTAYAVNDVVTYNGSTYIATVANQNGGTPDVNTGDWALMAQQGATGSAGATGPQGAAGQQGPQGLMGATGPQGSEGPAGTNGTNGIGFNFTGTFSNSASYNVNDVATYNGSSYVATVASQGGGTPDVNTADWTLMAQQGAAGPTGATGPQGAAGQQGPQGPQGPMGPAGPQGPQGPPGTVDTSNLAVLSASNTFQASQTVNGTLNATAAVLGLKTITFSGTPTFDASAGNTMKIVLAGDVTSPTLQGAQAGQSFIILVCQDSTGGHSFAPPPNVKWNTIPTTDANFCTAESFIFDGTTAYNLSVATYVVSGTITGLNATGASLFLNSTTTLPLAANATRFSFPVPFFSGQSYAVTVAQQPASLNCSLANASGVISNQDITNIVLNCVSNTTVPGAPTAVSATAGNAAATVNWSAPSSNGGSPILSYTVTASPGGSSLTVASSPTTATLTGLTNGIPYTFTVTAANAVGSGPASAASPAVTPATVPGAVSTPLGLAGAASVTLSWTAPTNNGSPIDSYLIYTYVNGVFMTQTTVGNVTSTVISGTPACPYPTVSCGAPNMYTFVVYAHNAFGYGPSSPASAAIRPLVSYTGDNVHGIWAAKGCTACHITGGGNPPALDASATTVYNNLLNTPNVVSGADYLQTCPTGQACPTSHQTYFTTLSNEYNAIVKWISDGLHF